MSFDNHCVTSLISDETDGMKRWVDGWFLTLQFAAKRFILKLFFFLILKIWLTWVLLIILCITTTSSVYLKECEAFDSEGSRNDASYEEGSLLLGSQSIYWVFFVVVFWNDS